MRASDHKAIKEFGIREELLMENAGLAGGSVSHAFPVPKTPT